MKAIKNTEYFKRLAIKRLGEKNKIRTEYPINERDILIHKECPLCRSSKLESLAEVYINKNFNILTTAICKNCLFVFRSVSPRFSWFKKCWEIISSEELEVFNPKAEKYKEKRYKIYKNMIFKYAQSGKLLDIGASYGTGSNVFKKSGFDVYAIEAEKNKINYLAKKLKIPVVSDSIEKSFNSGKFDVAIFSNCLEHLDSPTFVISKMGKLLSSSGIMLLAVPYLWESVNWSDALYLTHKSNFTVENMFELLLKNNFRIIEMARIPYFQEVVYIIKKSTDAINPEFVYSNRYETIRNVKLLYRRDLPLKISLGTDKTIKYSVPYIDQFFQTVNLDKHIIRWQGGYVTFYPK